MKITNVSFRINKMLEQYIVIMDSYENKNLVLRNKTIVGWNIKLKQNDAVSTWFIQRKLNGARFNTKVNQQIYVEFLEGKSDLSKLKRDSQQIQYETSDEIMFRKLTVF